MNCAENLLEPLIFFNFYTKSPENSGSESPWRKRDITLTWNLDIINQALPALGHTDPLANNRI